VSRRRRIAPAANTRAENRQPQGPARRATRNSCNASTGSTPRSASPLRRDGRRRFDHGHPELAPARLQHHRLRRRAQAEGGADAACGVVANRFGEDE